MAKLDFFSNLGFVETLRKIGSYIFRYFTKTWGFLFVFVEAIFSIVKWFKLLIVGSFALVWSYVAAYYLVVTIRRFILFPFLVTAFIYLVKYAYTDYAFTFLDGQSISTYLTSIINSHDYLVNASVFLYQIGLLQALVIYFNFIIVTFIVKMFINTFKKD